MPPPLQLASRAPSTAPSGLDWDPPSALGATPGGLSHAPSLSRTSLSLPSGRQGPASAAGSVHGGWAAGSLLSPQPSSGFGQPLGWGPGAGAMGPEPGDEGWMVPLRVVCAVFALHLVTADLEEFYARGRPLPLGELHAAARPEEGGNGRGAGLSGGRGGRGCGLRAGCGSRGAGQGVPGWWHHCVRVPRAHSIPLFDTPELA